MKARSEQPHSHFGLLPLDSAKAPDSFEPLFLAYYDARLPDRQNFECTWLLSECSEHIANKVAGMLPCNASNPARPGRASREFRVGNSQQRALLCSAASCHVPTVPDCAQAVPMQLSGRPTRQARMEGFQVGPAQKAKKNVPLLSNAMFPHFCNINMCRICLLTPHGSYLHKFDQISLL